MLDNNKGNIYMAAESPPSVFEAYFNQFKTDFTKILRMRSEEIISNGRLVLALLGRSIADPTSKDCFYLLDYWQNHLKTCRLRYQNIDPILTIK